MPTEPFHRLFFAIRPPAEAVAQIAALRDALGQTRGIVPDDQLHLTTWLFPDRQEFPADWVALAMLAMRGVPCDAFSVVLDGIVSGTHVALVPSDPLSGFIAFQVQLDIALRDVGLVPRTGWHFAPHLTLLNRRQDVVRSSVDPVTWTATHLLLIDSVVGRRRHDVIAQWTLP